MKPIDAAQSLEFNLEGQFMGFVGCPKEWKSLRLKLQSGEIQIKLPKHLRQSLRGFLSLEQPLRVVGLGKLNPDTLQLKFKATQVTLLSRFEPTPLPTLTCPIPAATTHTAATTVSAPACAALSITATIPNPDAPNPNTPKLKVRVCQKSGCIKKGGKGLCDALKKVLTEREIAEYVTIERMGCVKRCSAAPNIAIGKEIYSGVRPHQLKRVTHAISQRLAKVALD